MSTESGASTGAPKTEQTGKTELSPTALSREKAGKTVRPLLVSMAENPDTAKKADADPSLKRAVDALSEYRAILTTAPFETPPGEPVKLEGGNPVTLKLSKGEDIFDAPVTGIVSLSEDPANGRVYTVQVEVDGKIQTIPIPEVALADAQLAAEGDEILKLLPDGPEKQLLQGYLPLLDQRQKEGDPEPASVDDTLLTDMATKYPESLIQPEKAPEEPAQMEAPQTESMIEQYKGANAEIDRQIGLLEKKIEGLKGKEKKEAQDRLLAMKIAREHNGLGAAFEKADVLDAARDAATTPQERAQLEAERRKLDPIVEQADQKLAELLQQEGVTQEQLAEWKKIASDPNQGVAKLFERPDVLALRGIQEFVTGPNFDQAKVDKIIDESHLTPQQKAWLKKTGKGLLWTILIALSLPIIAGVGIAFAGANMAKQG